MGQYFQATVTKGNTTSYYSSFDYDSGSKLTEHSWIGNHYVDGIARKIYKKTARLVWAGDYANDIMEQVVSADGTVCKFTPDQLYGGCKSYKDSQGTWHYDKLDGLKKGAKTKNVDFDYKNKYFVNHSRKEYLDLNEYIKRSTMKDGWCQNPVSLLTAIGNGQGGGDYDTDAIDAVHVGRWAFDEVTIVDKEPVGYEKLYITFDETRTELQTRFN